MRGDRAAAVAALWEMYREGRRSYWLMEDVAYEELRDDPRFRALAERMRADLDRQRERAAREGWL
jgi:hypothetical protein